jgi:hypothetical protein
MKKVYQFDRPLSHRQSLMLSSGFEIVIKLRQANHLSCPEFGVLRQTKSKDLLFVGSHQSLQAWNF